MRRFTWPVVAVAMTLVVALSVGIATASAGGGNSANAHLCQQGGWMTLVRSDSTAFNNQGECVSYGAQGGTLMAKPTCTASSEDFSADTEFSQPTTFAGGTIDGPYATTGGVYIQGSSWGGVFADGSHLLFNGLSSSPFRLTFTTPVSSVQLDAQPNELDFPHTVTLKAYDSSNALVDSDTATVTHAVASLSVSSTTGNNIKYFTVEIDHIDGVGFTNIVWCA